MARVECLARGTRPCTDSSGEGPELVAEEVERHRDRDGDRLGAQFAGQVPATSSLEHGQVDASEARLTVKKRAAWKPAGPSPGPEGPVAVPEEVAGDGDAEGADRGDRVVDAEIAGEQGEDGEVDQVAGAADEAELEQLPPAGRAPGGGADAVGEFGGGLIAPALPERFRAVDDDGVEAEAGLRVG